MRLRKSAHVPLGATAAADPLYTILKWQTRITGAQNNVPAPVIRRGNDHPESSPGFNRP